ncbi:dynamin family protein [uncultured Thiodictyon sp.]|uniref:dynamin family protein n=1 Tax=uncultured Thiodictyon sp. TaxID=1846217 RepID=UPI0025FE15F5|nr:dynamin family protein [uncultured Thiodictyon sp.]
MTEQTTALHERLATYQEWKVRVEHAVAELETWLAAHQRATSRTREQLRTTRASLASDRLTLAVVAEQSRGKTELINALFFSELGVGLLPAAMGGATLCPTELLWDAGHQAPYLRLLPVETRAEDMALAGLKADPQRWIHYPLDLRGPQQLAGALREILQTKQVSLAQAVRLGLSSVDPTLERSPDTATVEIPKWRYAMVSLPHPLLKQGLVILYTPGAAALEHEPELTISMLPAAAAVLFVLAADTDVTDADLAIWQQHLKGGQAARQRAILVALNKVDRLWGDGCDAVDADAMVATRRRGAAQALGIAEDQVFPVSARQALVAAASKDAALLRRSALPVLERHLAGKLLETKRQSLIETIDAGAGAVLDRNRNRISSRLAHVKSQLGELEQLREQRQDVIAQLLGPTRREQARYLKAVQRLQQSRETLLTQTSECRRLLEREAIDAMVARAQDELLHSWSTAGLRRAMKGLFDELRLAMQTVAVQSEGIRKQVRETYQVFRDDFAYDLATPQVFVPMRYRLEIELLYQEVEVFRHSPGMALSGQGMVIRRFNQQLVSRAQALFEQLRLAYDGWMRDSLQPLVEDVQEHKLMMQKRLENLQRIGRSKDALRSRIDEMQGQSAALDQELKALRMIYNALHDDPF